MGKSEHSDRVRGVPGKLPRIFNSCSTMPSSESRVTGLLDEISELKGLLIVQQQRLQAHATQYESQHQLIQTQVEQYEAQQEVIRKQQQDML
jgi:hypothetical protein